MANNPYVNKVQKADGTTLIDLTTDTAVASDVAQGKYFHLASGERVAGTASGGGGADYIRTVICPEQSFSGAGGGSFVLLTDALRLIDGDYYIITYDNVEYVCSSVEFWGSDRFAGSIQLSWGAGGDLIYPFCIEDWNANPGPAVYASDSSEHSIKIEHLELLTSGTTLVPKTVTANGTYDPEDDDADGYSEFDVNVASGPSMNVQTVQSTTRRNSTSLGSIISLTCSKAGTYDVYWTCARSNTSQTWGSQLYINGVAYGTENTEWSNNVQNNHLTGVVLANNDTVAVYGRSRNGYYIHAPQLTIMQTG